MGAGCIIENEGRILALITNKGLYDLPKGTEDSSDESAFHTAQRETWEECGIWVTEDQVLGQFEMLKMTLFITAWDKTPPEIQPNPETGDLEHSGWIWVTPNEFKKKCLRYLVPYIKRYQTIMFL